jgi:hypothetical protein
MRAAIIISVLWAMAFAIGCGNDGGGVAHPQADAVGVVGSAADLPQRPLPKELFGPWSEIRYWNEGTTTGPRFYSRATITAKSLSLTSGEDSKDSGEWTISGRYGVASGEGTAASPFRLRMLVERSDGEDRHPAPVPAGRLIDAQIYLDHGVLNVAVPGDSLTLKREGAAVIGEPPGPIEPAFTCAADGDCLNSCNHGAVNRAWYVERYPGDERCEDGCTSKGTEPAKCLDGLCVAFRLGQRAEDCTRRKAEVIPGPGPAHSCATDDDCSLSCMYGAVNRSWYSYSVTRDQECKDGCASKGMDAKCEQGRCLAFRRGEPSPGCSGRNVHNPKP